MITKLRMALDKFYVRVFRPRYCNACGSKLKEIIEPYKFDTMSGVIKSFIFDLYCPSQHVWYTYTEPAPKGFAITLEDWDSAN